MNIGVIGTGYVGMVLATALAEVNYKIWCSDSNDKKINGLNNGQLPFFEPGLEELFLKCRSRMNFSHEYTELVENVDTIFLAIGTPEMPDGSSDMRATMACVKELCKIIKSPKRLILKSTVPVGTSTKIKEYCRAHSVHDISVINNPEFLRQGSALHDFKKPDRIVIGAQSQADRDYMLALYAPFLKDSGEIIFMDNNSAEMTKYVANSFLAMKISFINEIAILADRLGADIEQIRRGIGSDHRINPYFLNPGLGYGGSCFPKDVHALNFSARQANLKMHLLEATDKVNERQKQYLYSKIEKRFEGSLISKHIAVWGLSFKPNTDDIRRAPAIQIIRELISEGYTVTAYDPVAGPNALAVFGSSLELASSAVEATKNADALVIVTEWPEFKTADFRAIKLLMKRPIIFDGRNHLDKEKIVNGGFEYHCIGFSAEKSGNNDFATKPNVEFSHMENGVS